MGREEDDQDSLPPLGENTDKFLDQAKKGQPRNFLLVCKGNKLNYLAVRKKPIKKNEIVEAKKLGYKGEGYFGVISGQGMELVFNLSSADGYTAAPVKDKILKDFLEEKADFKCKPTIVIVATLPEVPFDDEDLSHPLVARFIALGEQISQVLDVNPNAAGELTQSTTEIRALLQSADFETAEPRVNALASRLQELLSGTTANVPGPSTTTTSAQTVPGSSQPSPNNDSRKLKLQEALNKLVPQLKQAVVTFPEKKVELLTPVAQIKKDIDSDRLDEAKQGILAVGQLLKSLVGQGNNTAQSQEENTLREEYERKYSELQPLYEQVLRELLGDTGKFRAVMTMAREQAEAKVYATAIKVIDRLAIAIKEAIAVGSKDAGVTGDGSIASTAALLQLRMAKLEAVRGVGRLELRLRETKDKSAIEIANTIRDIAARFPSRLEPMLEELEKIAGSNDAEATTKVKGSARKALDDWGGYLKKHELAITGCEKNPWNIPVSITTPINDALNNIRTVTLA